MSCECGHCDHCDERGDENPRRELARILTALGLFVAAELLVNLLPISDLRVQLVLFAVPYLIAGAEVLAKAARSLAHGRALDENFLMAVASLGAFALVAFPDTGPHMAEGAAVMIFYQVGEWFQDFAVDRSRRSIAEMMDIAPEFANVVRDSELVQVAPESVAVGELIACKPGERVPLDGIVETGSSQLDTAALTGESAPRAADVGNEVASGCINLTGVLEIRVTRAYSDSTVSRILELVENASEKKARTENFITRFARYYTPIVVGAALLLAIAPPLLFGQPWADWVERGLIFLVVSCPCALVISVPLSFFGGIGGASRSGILVKGGNYLEALSRVETIAFDKTGTLTSGSFEVVEIAPHEGAGLSPEALLELAAHAEAFSNHPIALSVREAHDGEIDATRVAHAEEHGGRGVSATVDGQLITVGNDRLMADAGLDCPVCELAGTVLHVSIDGSYAGRIVIADVMKPDAAEAIAGLHAAGVKRTVMLTGDRADVAAAVAADLRIDDFRAELLPQDKVAAVEALLDARQGSGKVAFAGDGINDAPVLMRADVGIAMGAMGADAAIEAADVVLMDDQPSKIAKAIRIAKKTMRIVWQNIVFALGVKFAVLILAALGIATMWLAVFADVGVACLAILNALRALRARA